MAAPWVILRRRLCLGPKKTLAEHPAAISVALREPPRASILDVSQSIHPSSISPDKLPYLIVTGPSAHLLSFSAGEASTITDNLIFARQFASPADLSRQPTTGSAELVPCRTGPSMPVTYNVRSIGLISAVFGGYQSSHYHR